MERGEKCGGVAIARLEVWRAREMRGTGTRDGRKKQRSRWARSKRRAKVKGEVDGNVKRVARAGESEAWVWRRERGTGTKESKGVEAGRGRWKQRKGGGGDERQRAAKVKESKG